mgnify:CR=1 FL=1
MLEIDVTGTELVLEYLRNVAAGRVDPKLMEEIVSDPGYQVFIRRQRAMANRTGEGRPSSVTDEEFSRFLVAFARGEEWDGALLFSKLGEAFRRAMTRLDLHAKVLDKVKELDVSGLESQVLQRLPEGATLDATVYFLAEVHPDAYVFGGSIVVSFFPLVVSRGSLFSGKVPVLPVLCHELHHIGLASISPSLDEATKEGLVLSVIGGLLGEGAATMFFTPPEGGPHWESWRETAADLPGHYQEFEKMLQEILEGSRELPEARAELFQRFFRPYRKKSYPAGYVLGVDMCRTIYRRFGEAALVDVMARPSRFLRLYNEAADEGEYRFGDGLVQELWRIGEAGQAWPR